MVAVRWDDDELEEAVTVTIPLLEPDSGDTVSHVAALLLTVQLILEATVNVFCSPDARNSRDVSDTVKTGATPICVTLMVCELTPCTLLLTVMVAVREAVIVLAVAVTVIMPLFVPEEDDTVSQDEASLPTVHLSLELMESVFDSLDEAKFNELSDTDSVI